MKKATAFLICLSLLLSLLAACSPASEDNADGGGDTTAPETTAAPTVDENGYLLDRLPADLKFNNAEIGILYWSDVERQEFESTGLTGDIINDAIWERNRAVEERLGVTLKWYSTAGNSGNRQNFLAHVRSAQASGDRAYDIIATYSISMGLLTSNGFMRDLSDIPHLDLEMPWWPDSLLKRATINDKLYFISGDASTMLLHMMYGIFYNVNNLTNYNIDDPIKLVDSGKWTIDKLIELTSGAYRDLNGNQTKDTGDFFGFTTNRVHNDAFYSGSALMLVDQDPDKTLIISPDYTSEKLVNLIQKLSGWELGPDAISNDAHMTIFTSGNALFKQDRLYVADNYLRNVEFSYGILPTPKYDENQEKYITIVGNPITLFGVTSDSVKEEMAGAVLECWGSEGYRRTTPAIFETSMKIKYSENEDVSRMFDLIREGVDFDLGRIFNTELSDMIGYVTTAIVNGTQWASVSASYKTLLDNMTAKLVTDLKNNYG